MIICCCRIRVFIQTVVSCTESAGHSHHRPCNKQVMDQTSLHLNSYTPLDWMANGRLESTKIKPHIAHCKLASIITHRQSPHNNSARTVSTTLTLATHTGTLTLTRCISNLAFSGYPLIRLLIAACTASGARASSSPSFPARYRSASASDGVSGNRDLGTIQRAPRRINTRLGVVEGEIHRGRWKAASISRNSPSASQARAVTEGNFSEMSKRREAMNHSSSRLSPNRAAPQR